MFYDDICFEVNENKAKKTYSDVYTIHKNYVPAHDYFLVKIKNNLPVPFEDKEKMVIKYRDGKKTSGIAAENKDGWYEAKLRNFGDYYLDIDTTAPTISSLQKTNDLSNAKTIRFSVKEETTSVKEFRATLDGQWILFEPFGNVYTYKFDKYCGKGKHQLIIKAKDENDNEAVLKYEFVR